MAKTKTPHGNEDDSFFRCRRCNFPVNLRRDKTGSGSGISLTAITINGKSLYDPVVSSGCPFCGTRNYKNWQK